MSPNHQACPAFLARYDGYSFGTLSRHHQSRHYLASPYANIPKPASMQIICQVRHPAVTMDFGQPDDRLMGDPTVLLSWKGQNHARRSNMT